MKKGVSLPPSFVVYPSSLPLASATRLFRRSIPNLSLLQAFTYSTVHRFPNPNAELHLVNAFLPSSELFSPVVALSTNIQACQLDRAITLVGH
jgi:hypothetical protein